VALVEWLRRLRLQIVLRRWLLNGGAVWRAYRAPASPPPLRFRGGFTLEHGLDDGPVFLLLEIFQNACYGRGLGATDTGTVVDIGANIGAFVVKCARDAPNVRIHAYEPSPGAFATLQRNVESNHLQNRVSLFCEAAGATDGRGMMEVHGPSLIGEVRFRADSRGAPVRVSSLRTILDRVDGPIRLLKIDIEGAEADVIEGASAESLRRVRRTVIECHPARVIDVEARLSRALGAAGFACRIRRSRRCGTILDARRL
jgi:FkbM family methyltransferase